MVNVVVGVSHLGTNGVVQNPWPWRIRIDIPLFLKFESYGSGTYRQAISVTLGELKKLNTHYTMRVAQIRLFHLQIASYFPRRFYFR